MLVPIRNFFIQTYTVFTTRTGKIITGCSIAVIILCAGSWLFIHTWLTTRREKRNSYNELIVEASQRHAMSRHLVKAVIWRESNFQAHARGKAGEIGLMQISMGAAEDWAHHNHRSVKSKGVLFDPRLNVEIGTWYLARALRRWDSYRYNTVLALAQYNAGPGRVLEWVPEDKRKNPHEDISFPSTRQYIKAVLERKEFYKNQVTLQ